jgi:hypothetical protein
MGENAADFYEVPARYERDMLHALVRDANTIHVYWEISNRRRWLATRHFQCDWGALPKVLRIYDTTGIYFNGYNAHRHGDIETTPEAQSWYIHGLNGNATYIVDIGTYNLGRQFIPLLRSNPVVTPRDMKAGPAEPIVGVVEEARLGAQKRIEPHFPENFSVYQSI